MTLDQRITQAEAELKVAWRNGVEERAAEWQRTLDMLLDVREFAQDKPALRKLLERHADHVSA